MQAIVTFLEGIGLFLAGLVDLVISLVSDIIYVITLAGRTLLQLPSYLEWIPREVRVMLFSLFAIVVVYKVIGREG